MFNAKSSTIACPACGRENQAAARFCEACAARLGAEPSIGPDAPPLTVSAVRDADGDSRFDGSRTVHSRPSSLTAAPASNAGFWLKFGIAGLVVMIGFIAWSLYILTGSKAPTQLPAAQVSAEPPPVAASAAPAASSAAPSPPPLAASSSLGAAADETPRPPAPVVRATRAASTVPPAASRTGNKTAVRASSQRQAAARERARPSPSEVRPADFGGWVEPSRPPAMTSAPNYQDAGPPIVAGPGPREPLTPTSPAQPAGSVAATGRQDLGPPVSPGPGPRYDYSTPNAVGR